jgi:hypothetical protein
MCKIGLVKYFCKVCPPVSAADLPMTEEEAHALNMKIRYDSEAEGIVSNIDPETREYFAALRKVICNEDKYETSENYTIHGQFTTGELASRARKRLFNWDMYVWRLPSVEELRDFQAVLRKRLRKWNVLQTTETVLNWSDTRRGENALVVVTQENEDFWQYLYHYPMGGTSGGFYRSKDGPRRGDEKELPITHCYPVRPVRDFYAKKIFEEEKK